MENQNSKIFLAAKLIHAHEMLDGVITYAMHQDSPKDWYERPEADKNLYWVSSTPDIVLTRNEFEELRSLMDDNDQYMLLPDNGRDCSDTCPCKREGFHNHVRK